MRTLSRHFSSLLLAAVVASPLFLTGCAVHARVYDPYYHDYHGWNGEVVYYNRWERDTHRDHLEWEHRNESDKKAYWDWRHTHEEHH